MPARTKKLSAKEVLAELRRMQKLSKKPISASFLNNSHRSLYKEVLRHFGSMEAARKAAGLSPPPPARKRWTQEMVTAELKRLHGEGVRLTSWNLRNSGFSLLVDAANAYCGGLVRARLLARLPEPHKKRARPQPWDEERVIEEILDLDKRGESLAPSKVPPTLVGAAYRYFGSWEQAVTAAGFDYGTIRPRRTQTIDGLMDELRQLSRQKPGLTRGELSNMPIATRIRRRIGPLDEVLERAGIRDWPVRRIWPVLGRRETLNRLLSRHEKGLPLYEEVVARKDPRLASSVHRHFEFWEDALAAVGLPNDSPYAGRVHKIDR